MIHTTGAGVTNNEDIIAISVLFEPNAFNTAIEEYSFYLTDGDSK